MGHVMRPPTQNERILELLADRDWHTTREILAAVPCIVHSRVAEINATKPGYRIEHEGAGGGAENHRYRLTSTPGETVPQDASPCVLDTVDDGVLYPGAPPVGPVSTVSPGTEANDATDGHTSELAVPATYEQLTLVAA